MLEHMTRSISLMFGPSIPAVIDSNQLPHRRDPVQLLPAPFQQSYVAQAGIHKLASIAVIYIL